VIDGLGQSGSERSLAELLPYLYSADIRTTILCLNHRESGVQKFVEDAGHDVRFLKHRGWSGRIYELRKILQKEKPTIMHSTLFASNIIGRIAAAGLDIRVISSIVNTPYDETRKNDPGIQPHRHRMVQEIDGWTSRNLTTHFHAVSHSAKTAAIRHLRIPGEKITVIERGRNESRLGRPGKERRFEARAKLGIKEKQTVIVNVGRHEYQKGQQYLVEAIGQLKPSNPDLLLLIAGRKGTVTTRLEQLTEKNGLNSNIRFLGHRDDVPDILAAADIFVFPSLFEGLPGSVVEAMALQLPIVASDIPPLHEVVEPGCNALLVPPASVEPLSIAIRTLIQDSGKKTNFGIRSREIFEERFTLERCASRMIAFYHEVASH
jgi:glycosyltransferase involved in cell wall biosynthesis